MRDPNKIVAHLVNTETKLKFLKYSGKQFMCHNCKAGNHASYKVFKNILVRFRAFQMNTIVIPTNRAFVYGCTTVRTSVY